jgi:hypothetical protein
MNVFDQALGDIEKRRRSRGREQEHSTSSARVTQDADNLDCPSHGVYQERSSTEEKIALATAADQYGPWRLRLVITQHFAESGTRKDSRFRSQRLLVTKPTSVSYKNNANGSNVERNHLEGRVSLTPVLSQLKRRHRFSLE